MANTKMVCLSIGQGGFSAHNAYEVSPHGGGSSSTIQGYDRDPDRIVASLTGDRTKRGDRNLDCENAIVIDKRIPCDGPDAGKLVFKAPMLDLSEPSRFADLDTGFMGNALVAYGGTFGAMVAMARGGSLNLDSVGLADYVAYWRAAGARIGRIVASAIQWESAE